LAEHLINKSKMEAEVTKWHKHQQLCY
jgi:hypothetical protein